MSKKNYDEYGHRMLESFDRIGGLQVDFFSEDQFEHNGIQSRSLYKLSPDLARFHEKHADRFKKTGDYNKDVRRFSFKSFCIADYVLQHGDEWVLWFDADTICHHRPSGGFENLLAGYDGQVVYFGRKGYHTEGGFYGFLSAPEIDRFMQHWKWLYLSGHIFKMQYQHDCGVFDMCLQEFPEVTRENLSPWAVKTDHAFVQSFMGRYVDHAKGNRKTRGRSSRADLRGKNIDVSYYK